MSQNKQTKYAMKGCFRTSIDVSGNHSGIYKFKHKFRGGYEVYENDRLLLNTNSNVEFNGREIGELPGFWFIIFRGYFGQFKTDHGTYSIKKSGKRSLDLFLNDNAIGSIHYETNRKEIVFQDNGCIKFPYQLAMACALYNLIYVAG